MRQILLLFALLSAFTLRAQTDSLTVHVEGQSLADLLTDEQKQNVNYLFITGTLADEDYAFLRENNLPKLHELNLRKANIDTIPKKAFYEWDFSYCSDGVIVLPESLSNVGDSAFYKSWAIIELTGKFPIIGFAAFAYSPDTKPNLEVSNENQYCKDSVGYILSLDGTILWYSRNTNHPLYKEIPKGVEIIEEKAFEYSSFCQITIPETVKEIRNHAFTNCFPDGTIDSPPEAFIMESIIPPALEEDVFGGYFFTHRPTLVVPDGAIELYANANVQWHKFAQIQSEVLINDIRSEEIGQRIIINKGVEKTDIICPISMRKVSIYNFQGKELFHIEFSEQEKRYSIPNMYNRIILEIILSTGEKYIVKL